MIVLEHVAAQFSTSLAMTPKDAMARAISYSIARVLRLKRGGG